MKNPSRMNQLYSRRSPHTGAPSGPWTSMRSLSSRMNCCSRFQLSSRLARTCFMKASRSLGAGTCGGAATSVVTPASANSRPLKRYGMGDHRTLLSLLEPKLDAMRQSGDMGHEGHEDHEGLVRLMFP